MQIEELESIISRRWQWRREHPHEVASEIFTAIELPQFEHGYRNAKLDNLAHWCIFKIWKHVRFLRGGFPLLFYLKKIIA